MKRSVNLQKEALMRFNLEKGLASYHTDTTYIRT